MRIRLYGGAGHQRMVYIPASVVIAPPRIAVPRLPVAEMELLLLLDPDLGLAPAGISYRDTGVDDPDGYRRYEFVGDSTA